MILKKKKQIKPLCKTFIRLRENVQNRKKILKFKKEKWRNFIYHFERKSKFYRKYKFKDQNLYLVSKFPIKALSYKQRFKNNLLAYKRLTLHYGGISKKRLKNLINNPRLKNNREVFLGEFERRIDTVLFRSKFCISIRNSRQLISHGNISVNGRKVKTSSYVLKQGDLITIDSKASKTIENNLVYQILNSNIWPLPPKYLYINYETMEIIFGCIKNQNDIMFTNFDFHVNLERISQNYKYQ